jgi:hypothetical protein
MCFSATASFTAAALTGGLGVATVGRVTNRAEAPLAIVPVLFAVQQLIEGSLWLALEGEIDPGLAQPLVYAFLLFAQVWWPIFVPLAVLMAEPDRERRRLIGVLLAAGLAVGLHLLWAILTGSHRAGIIDEHLVYTTEAPHPLLTAAAYFAATVLPPLLSSRRVIALLGLIVLVGAAAAYLFYWYAFISVWCFFAAAVSGIILFHFERRHRLHSGLTSS